MTREKALEEQNNPNSIRINFVGVEEAEEFKNLKNQQPCEDCVSREDVINIIKYTTMSEYLSDILIDKVDKLPSVTFTQWHKVRDELPKENGVYLACYEDATVLLDWFNGKWFFHGKNPAVEETGTIIAWMELPEWKE